MGIFDVIRRKKWDLGIIRISEGHRWNLKKWDYHIIKAPKNCWYADPFILEITPKYIVLLVEEYSYSINKGRIARLIIDKNSYKIKDSKIILEIDTHLSFPNIYKKEEKIYVFPENSESGGLYLYEYKKNENQLLLYKKICSQPLTDAIYTESFGQPMLFATKLPVQNKNILFIYKFDKKKESFVPYKEVLLADNTARGAGNFFISDGKLIRPAQNCNNGYGCGLVFQTIDFVNGEFVVNELSRMNPPKGYDGMHTYNMQDDYVVVDLHKCCHPYIHRILQSIKRLL